MKPFHHHVKYLFLPTSNGEDKNYLFLGLWLCLWLFMIPALAFPAEPAPDPTNPHEVYPSRENLGRGIIGLALNVTAHRIGDPARLYIQAVHPKGPAARNGLAHGDEILEVDGNSVNGKTYEQIIRLIRGEVGASVSLKVQGRQGTHVVTITRIDESVLLEHEKTS